MRNAITKLLLILLLPQTHLAFGHCANPPISDSVTTIPNCRVRVVDEVQLASERSGILATVAAPGSYVRAGDVVAQLRDSAMMAHLAILEKEAANDIEVRFARKAQQLAQLKYERALDADRAVDGTVTDFELRELRLAAEKALLQQEQAEYQLQLAELRRQEQLQKLRSLRITAPFEGFVRATYKVSGEVVAEGEPIVEIVNTQRVRIEGFAEVAQLPGVQPGDPVQVTIQPENSGAVQREQVFPGKITFVDVKVEPVANKVRVWAEVQNQHGFLRDGNLATIIVQRPSTDSSHRH